MLSGWKIKFKIERKGEPKTKKTFKNKSILILIFVILSVLCIVNVFGNVKNYAYADFFIGSNVDLTRQQLHYTTKNFTYTNNAPIVTVLTHGLGGSAADWSNDGTFFAYDKDSLIEQLRINNDNVEVYKVTVETKNANNRNYSS